MPISEDTEQRMKQIEEQVPAGPEDPVEPKQGWQCPACGSVYDQQGICPVDEALLTQIENWSGAAAAASEETTTEEVMDTGDELYPARDR